MSKRIYVGNFPYSTTEEELRELFEQHGTVNSLDVIRDRRTGRSRGFGFVEMDETEADAAIAALDGREIGDRTLRVSEAKPRQESDRGRSGGRRGDRGGDRGGDRQGSGRDWD
jgi:RNA recognition motif-containing protein